jgi:enamine deaminase RidA (YjgF/YER057c/UK114 family)
MPTTTPFLRRRATRAVAATVVALGLVGGGVAVGASFRPKPTETTFNLTVPESGDPFLSSGVAVGRNVDVYSSAGTGPANLNTGAEAGTPERFIDPEQFPGFELPEGVTITEAQGLNTLQRIRLNLESAGLTMEDITFMRIYLEAPPGEDRADYDGWNRAYRKYMANINLNTGEVIPADEPVIVPNATRPARSNIEVATLPVRGWLVEIEVVASYPDGKRWSWKR